MSAPLQTPTLIRHGGLPAVTQMDTIPSGLLHELEQLGLSSRSLEKDYHSTTRGVVQGIVYRFCRILQETIHEYYKSAATHHSNCTCLQTSLRSLWTLWSEFSAVQELSFLNLAHSPMTFDFDAVCVKLVAPSDSSIGVARKFAMWRARAREFATGMEKFVRALLEAHVQTREGEEMFQHMPDYHIPDEEKARIEKAMQTFMSEGSVDADLVCQSWSLRRGKEDDEEKHGEKKDDGEEEDGQADNEENDRQGKSILLSLIPSNPESRAYVSTL